jgi:hypothetical protein
LVSTRGWSVSARSRKSSADSGRCSSTSTPRSALAILDSAAGIVQECTRLP